MFCLLNEIKYQSHVRVRVRFRSGSCPVRVRVRVWFVSGSCLVRVRFVSGFVFGLVSGFASVSRPGSCPRFVSGSCLVCVWVRVGFVFGSCQFRVWLSIRVRVCLASA